MKKGLIGGVAVAAAAAFGAGCVNLGLLGVPLGPQVQEGIAVLGAIPPTINPGFGCSWLVPSLVFLPNGEMEVGTGNSSPNEYIAILDVRNTLPSNECNKNPGLQPNYQGRFGCNDSTGITVVTANIRYEYPSLTAFARFSNQQLPADGFLQASATSATGYAANRAEVGIATKVIDKAMARRLAEDPDFQAALGNDQVVPIVARIRLEGRTDGGARVTSNEYTFRIEVRKSGTFQNCMQATVCPAPQTFRPNTQCFPGQDQKACSCQ